MDFSGIDPRMNAESSMARATGGDVEALKKLAEGGAEKIEEVAEKFEAVFIGFLVKQMWESVEKSDLLPEGPGRSIYDGFFTSMMADHIAENGGIGIARNLVDQFKAAQASYDRQMKGEAPGTDPEMDGGEGPESAPGVDITH